MQQIKYFYFLILCFLISMLLTGCGSKGDLYQVQEPNSVNKTLSKDPQYNFQQSTKELKKKSY